MDHIVIDHDRGGEITSEIFYSTLQWYVQEWNPMGRRERWKGVSVKEQKAQAIKSEEEPVKRRYVLST